MQVNKQLVEIWTKQRASHRIRTKLTEVAAVLEAVLDYPALAAQFVVDGVLERKVGVDVAETFPQFAYSEARLALVVYDT